jgi:hypothetical protein
MTKQTNFQRIRLLVLMTIAMLFIADIQASAQKKDYKPGEEIEYKSSGYLEMWEEVIFVRATPDGSQPIIRQMPNEFHKDGYQRGASWADIRPLTAKPNKASVVTNQNENPVNDTGADYNRTTSETTNDVGTGLMTQSIALPDKSLEGGE